MWRQGWRETVWAGLDQPRDVIIIGGGITGAGILHLASQAGLRALLLEANDFAFGTSSRSSKLVHGGFRYLRNRQYKITRESVQERQWLLHEAKGLVTPLRFVMPTYHWHRTPAWQLGLGVVIYDLMAPKWRHRAYTARQLLDECPQINPEELSGGYQYCDASVDDSRLVLRILRDAVQLGGTALNYASVESLLRTRDGQVRGVQVCDQGGGQGRMVEVEARVVINAAGPWCDELRYQLGAPPRLRKLRGSHLVFPFEKLPLRQAITLFHRRDNRALFIVPWEGVSLIGTTDVDHDPRWEGNLAEPCASAAEIEYLLEALTQTLPGLDLTADDVLSTFSGLRPVIRSGQADPSRESRAHAVWQEDGLLTITGGKLTTFRVMAREALRAAQPRLPKEAKFPRRARWFIPPQEVPPSGLEPEALARLAGRYGAELASFLNSARPEELERVEGLPTLWAELRWSACNEDVLHLDDLLLRRVRLGVLLPQGGLGQMERIRAIVQPELGWSEERWQREAAAYAERWRRYYSPDPSRAVALVDASG